MLNEPYCPLKTGVRQDREAAYAHGVTAGTYGESVGRNAEWPHQQSVTDSDPYVKFHKGRYVKISVMCSSALVGLKTLVFVDGKFP